MFETHSFGYSAPQPESPRRVASEPGDSVPSPGSIRHLKSGERLFGPGETKDCIYRIESGLIEIMWEAPDGLPETIEKIPPATFFGLGFLGDYIYRAEAMVESVISCWPKASSPYLTKNFPEFREREAEANQRQFAHRRRMLLASTGQALPQRLAAFLGAASKFNSYEGRDPTVIDDGVKCNVVADYLKTDIEALGEALHQLAQFGAIELLPPRGLRICDPELLEFLTAGPTDTSVGCATRVQENAHRSSHHEG